jgi:hypothetical protein
MFGNVILDTLDCTSQKVFADRLDRVHLRRGAILGLPRQAVCQVYFSVDRSTPGGAGVRWKA